MNQSRLLAVGAVCFLLVSAVAYFAVLGDPGPSTEPPPKPAEQLEAKSLQEPKVRPMTGPPPGRSSPPRFATSGRGTSNLNQDDEAETWAPNEHRIEGRVLAERSQPVAGVRVTYRTDGKRRTTKTDGDGRFRITARGNKVSLQAERKDGLFTVRSKSVEVSGEGGDWEVDLVLEEQRHGGLGVRVGRHKNGLGVSSVVANGPGSSLGLTKGDVILEAGGTTLAGLSTSQASDLLIGPDGSRQTILVRHSGGEEVLYTFVRKHLEK